jgi:hypothetical protein
MKNRKLLTIVVVLLAVPALLYTATTAYQAGRRTGGEMAYQIIETNTEDFLKLNTGEFQEWYENNYTVEGVHSFTRGNTTYILVSAGEKPTGGYLVKNIVLLQDKDRIRVMAVLQAPSKDEMVTEAITFPHALVSISNDKREIVLGSLDTEIRSELEEKTDSGTYIRLVEPNLVEIRISGVPEQIPPRSFRLYEDVAENFNSLGLKEGDQILFNYSKNINNEDVITELEIIRN